MTAKLIFKQRPAPGQRGTKVVGRMELRAESLDAIDDAIDGVIDPSGDSVEVCYTIFSDGGRIISRGYSI